NDQLAGVASVADHCVLAVTEDRAAAGNDGDIVRAERVKPDSRLDGRGATAIGNDERIRGTNVTNVDEVCARPHRAGADDGNDVVAADTKPGDVVGGAEHAGAVAHDQLIKTAFVSDVQGGGIRPDRPRVADERHISEARIGEADDTRL